MISFNPEGALFALFALNVIALIASVAGGLAGVEKRKKMNSGDACVGFLALVFLVVMGVLL